MSRPTRRRHFRLQTLIAFAALVGLGIGPAVPQDTPWPGVIVYICDSPSAPSRPWRNTLASNIARALSKPESSRVSVRGEAQCGVANVEVACNAGVYDAAGPVMACAPGTLIRLIRVAAWYAIQYAATSDDYEAFRRAQPRLLGLSAFMAVSKDEGGPLAEQIAALRKLSEDHDPADSTRTRLVFDGILQLVFAALVGHESSHLESRPPYCAIGNLSNVEESGLWKVILQISGSDQLYAPQTPVAEEVRADRCASRRIRLARAALESGNLSQMDRDFVRRASADIVSTMLLVQFGPDGVSPSISINDAYLYTPSRIVALTAEIGFGLAPTICGGAAEALTEAIQHTFKQRPGNGILPDEMENLLPRGVIAAWNRKANWSPGSFSCR